LLVKFNAEETSSTRIDAGQKEKLNSVKFNAEETNSTRIDAGQKEKLNSVGFVLVRENHWNPASLDVHWFPLTTKKGENDQLTIGGIQTKALDRRRLWGAVLKYIDTCIQNWISHHDIVRTLMLLLQNWISHHDIVRTLMLLLRVAVVVTMILTIGGIQTKALDRRRLWGAVLKYIDTCIQNWISHHDIVRTLMLLLRVAVVVTMILFGL
jgi:hypothetical protein